MVLRDGGLPLNILEEIVRVWTAEVKSGSSV